MPLVRNHGSLRRRRTWCRLGVVGACVLVGSLLAVGVGLGVAPAVLMVEGGQPRAQALVVLGGDLGDRVERALELYRDRVAPRIVVTGRGDGSFLRDRLISSGVASDAIYLEGAARTTQENAEFTVKLMREEGIRSAIVVTSWYHSRRALACFQKYGDGIDLGSRPALQRGRGRWQRCWEAKCVAREYIALAWYMLRHGISPLQKALPAGSDSAASDSRETAANISVRTRIAGAQ